MVHLTCLKIPFRDERGKTIIAFQDEAFMMRLRTILGRKLDEADVPGFEFEARLDKQEMCLEIFS